MQKQKNAQVIKQRKTFGWYEEIYKLLQCFVTFSYIIQEYSKFFDRKGENRFISSIVKTVTDGPDGMYFIYLSAIY